MNGESGNNIGLTRGIAFSGVCLGLCLVIIYLASFQIGPDNLLNLFSGLLVYGITRIAGFRYGGVLYAAASLLSWFIVPGKVAVFFFMVVFGPIGLAKGGIDRKQRNNMGKLSNAVLWIADIGISCLLSTIFTFAFSEFFLSIRDNAFFAISDTPIWKIVFALGFGILTGIVVHVVYPIAYTMMIRFTGKDKVQSKNVIDLPKLFDGQEDNDETSLD